MVMILFLGATLHVNSTTQPSVLEVIQNKDLHIQALKEYILAAWNRMKLMANRNGSADSTDPGTLFG